MENKILDHNENLQPLKTPIVITIANVVGSLNIVFLIAIGLMYHQQINFLYWGTTAILLIANVGLWKMKTWGLYTFIGVLLASIILHGYTDIYTNSSGAVFAASIYIWKAAWFD